MTVTYIHWIVFGILLTGVEILAPGAFFLWIGLAAIIVGALWGIMPLSFTSQLVIFALLAPTLAFLGRNLFSRKKDEVEEGMLNRRGDMMIGRMIVLSEDIEDGEAKTAIGDSHWTVRGEDMPRGTKVTIEKVEGNVLLVKRV